MLLCRWWYVDEVVLMRLCCLDDGVFDDVGVVWMVWALKKCPAIPNWDASSAAPTMQNEPEVLQVLHLPRKKRAEGAPSVAPATRNRGSAQSNQLSPGFRGPLWRCSKGCMCHAKRAEGAPSAAPATQNEAAPKVISCRRASADLYEGAPSAAPATQNEPEVLQALHLPRKRSLRCSKCCACDTKRGGAQSNQLWQGFRGRLWRWSKCCTCHAKRAWGAPSAAPATQNEPEVLQVLHLPRKTSLRCSKCCACHAERAGGAPSAAPPRKTSLRCSKCCACHAERAGGAPSAAPATQNDPWWRWVDDVLSMLLCWWCCVDGVVLMGMCGWCCVLMELCWWCVVDGDGLMVLCLWCVVDGVVLMVCCWWWWVVMVLCWWCCVDGVVVMVLCWWCVDGVVLCGGGGGRRRRRRDAGRKTKETHGNVGNYRLDQTHSSDCCLFAWYFHVIGFVLKLLNPCWW